MLRVNALPIRDCGGGEHPALTTLRPFLFVASLLLTACAAFAGDAAQTAAPAAHERGRALYNARCWFCHGYAGDARTVAASVLVPPPRDFTRADPAELDLARIERAISAGRPGTAMTGFARVLPREQIALLAAFVREEFVRGKAARTRYHTPENGWPDHERYRAAFAFAAGEVSPHAPAERLDPAQAAGRRLYMSACVTCHDRPSPVREEDAFALRSVTYPPANYAHGNEEEDPDDPYERHEAAPRLAGLDARERLGERLFQANCAHCHASDGSGRNWRGAFIEPPPPDFTRRATQERLTRARLLHAIAEGIDGTSMPAWKTVLPAGQIEALAAYMARAFGGGR